MAKRAVEQVFEFKTSRSGLKKPKCKTKQLKFNGNNFKSTLSIKRFKTKLIKEYTICKPAEINYLVDLYGDQAKKILDYASQLPKKQASNLIKGEIRFCIEQEMVLHLTDFFIHRTGRLFFDIKSVKDHLKLVAIEMKHWLDWSPETMKDEIELMEKEIKLATSFKGEF